MIALVLLFSVALATIATPALADTSFMVGHGTLTLRGGYGSISYHEDFDGIINGITTRLHGGTSASAYDVGLTYEQPLSDRWLLDFVADWISTGLILEPYQLHLDNFPLGGTSTIDQMNTQDQSLSLLGGDLRLAYRLPGSSLRLFALGGYRSMSAVYNGGTFTATLCTGSPPTCTTVSGGLSGGGTETFKGAALGGGLRFDWTSGSWTGGLEGHYASLPSVSIENNFVVPGQITTLMTSGSEWGLGVRANRQLSEAWSVQLGFDVNWTNITGTSPFANGGVFFPGGGWTTYIGSVGGTYRF